MLERYHLSFRRAGAHLDDAARARLGAISERLATLGTAFSQNIIADERDYTLELNGEADLAGLPEFVRAAARNAAEERDMPGKAVVTLSRSSVEPFLQFSSRRDLREKVFRAFIARGDGNGAADNKAIIAEIVKLRAERARLLGYESFAKYRLDDSMAKTPPRCAACSIRSGRAPAPAPSTSAMRCRSSCRKRAAISRSRRGTGAITPRNCASACTMSMRRP